MSFQNILKTTALLAAVSSVSIVSAQAADMEKCYGVAKAGQNSCASATGAHNCATHSTVDGAGDAFIALPKGLCNKLAGASLSPKK